MTDKPIVNRCRAADCCAPIASDIIMCFKHWKLVPVSLKKNYYRVGFEERYLPKGAEPSAAYRNVLNQCIAAVAWKEDERRTHAPSVRNND